MKQHGATVHLVTREVDVGPIILQAELSILEEDDKKSLAARVLKLEHQLYPFVLKCLINNTLILSSSKVIWKIGSKNLASLLKPDQEDFAKSIVWPTTN